MTMRGIARRMEREAQDARANAYMIAHLMRRSELPEFQEWVTGKKNRAAFVQKWTESWDKIDAALAA